MKFFRQDVLSYSLISFIFHFLSIMVKKMIPGRNSFPYLLLVLPFHEPDW